MVIKLSFFNGGHIKLDMRIGNIQCPQMHGVKIPGFKCNFGTIVNLGRLGTKLDTWPFPRQSRSMYHKIGEWSVNWCWLVGNWKVIVQGSKAC